jgi:hypothetical protein
MFKAVVIDPNGRFDDVIWAVWETTTIWIVDLFREI